MLHAIFYTVIREPRYLILCEEVECWSNIHLWEPYNTILTPQQTSIGQQCTAYCTANQQISKL
jgi:hypothetical protein